MTSTRSISSERTKPIRPTERVSAAWRRHVCRLLDTGATSGDRTRISRVALSDPTVGRPSQKQEARAPHWGALALRANARSAQTKDTCSASGCRRGGEPLVEDPGGGDPIRNPSARLRARGERTRVASGCTRGGEPPRGGFRWGRAGGMRIVASKRGRARACTLTSSGSRRTRTPHLAVRTR